MSEAALTRAVTRWLAAQRPGVWFYKTHGGAFARAGVPDLIVCVDGRFVAIELKAERGRVAPGQERELRQIGNAGGVAAVCRTLQEVIDAVTKNEKEESHGDKSKRAG